MIIAMTTSYFQRTIARYFLCNQHSKF